jgi:hypothetical protein
VLLTNRRMSVIVNRTHQVHRGIDANEASRTSAGSTYRSTGPLWIDLCTPRAQHVVGFVIRREALAA